VTDVVQTDLVTLTIDDTQVSVPKGTTIIRAAEKIGIAIPRFCDHPLLDPRGSCRQCLVDVLDAGNGRGFPAAQASCTMTVAEGMVVRTQFTSEKAKKAQAGIMELLLINHPLDCPICDKAGECPLQNQAMSVGRGDTRFDGEKRHYPKPLEVTPQLLLDRERCILCARCTRFVEEIAGDPFISLASRGRNQQVAVYPEAESGSLYSGNVVQICPVGAFTAKSYRFNARPFDLVSVDTTCEHCASGCSLRTDQRHGKVRRRLAGFNPEVNEEWNCDKGRFAFASGHIDRVETPLVRVNGELQPASWPEAIRAAAAGLKKAGDKVGVLPGGRLTLENAYAYSKFARVALGTNNIDYRSRRGSKEEATFLLSAVAGATTPSYADLETAKQVVLVAFDPEYESPIVQLRLIKAVKKGLKVVNLSAIRTSRSDKLKAEWIPVEPGAEAAALGKVKLDADSIILVGERGALAAGALKAVVEAANKSGARWAWIPRRAGEIGAVESGCLPNALPGGRPVADVKARVDVATAWGLETIPGNVGLDAVEIVNAGAEGLLDALVIGGVELRDLPDPAAAMQAIDRSFTVSLENRLSQAALLADVVLPTALIEEQSGHFLNWEHRAGVVNKVVKSSAMTDLEILDLIATEMDAPIALDSTEKASNEWAGFGNWEGERPALETEPIEAQPEGVLLTAWSEPLWASAANDGEENLAASARAEFAALSEATAKSLGLEAGDEVSVSGDVASIRLPLQVREMVDGTIWIPANSRQGTLGELGAAVGHVVTVAKEGK
jgi:NADH-quinone oxidoreductase subunit G